MDASTKWEAAVSCNRDYDGLFFYAVQTTGIYCRPSCPSKTPKRNHVLFFNNPTEAAAQGFRPCKRCRPDENDTPEVELVHRTKQFLQNHYKRQLSIHDIAEAVNVSPYHLGRVFKSAVSQTPHGYVEQLRIEQAKEYLQQGICSNTDIGYASGFQNPSSFYSAFKRHTGKTPNQYKKEAADVLR
ncbi:bifunctional transcriptional activator/DNA repair enzyme AdaA [Halobacillus sp. B23F22_1]|uniref:bifunctional transcriptional activator/DNA repair enzyme AdaA n=1 Tax=Halobacillus sp. B23F22_1 TaxID=3459514 RepID=UPI00373ECFFA